MISKDIHQKIYFWALAYLFFSVPFMSRWLPFTIGVVVLVINFLVERYGYKPYEIIDGKLTPHKLREKYGFINLFFKF